MLREKGDIQTNNATTKTTTETGELDPLKNTRRVKPISIQNRFESFQDDSETDEEQDENVNNDSQTQFNCTVTQSRNVQKRKPNKRQRQRRRQVCDMHTWDTQTTDARTTATQNTDISKAAAWCPGPEHCGSLLATVIGDNTTTTTTTHAIIITTATHCDDDACNSSGLQFSRGSTVTCPRHWRCHSSQGRCSNWSRSSCLLAGSVHSSHWPRSLDGVDVREAMPPHKAPPPAKLTCAEVVVPYCHGEHQPLQHPRGCQARAGTIVDKCLSQWLRTSTSSPAQIGGNPSIGTCPRRLIVNAWDTRGSHSERPQVLRLSGDSRSPSGAGGLRVPLRTRL